MSLATRCPSCNTVFRVVQDQLRVSEGWVRCGRCAEVFNASLHLVDPSTGEPSRSPIQVRARLPEPTADVDAAPPPTPPPPPLSSPPPSRTAPTAPPGAASARPSAGMPFDALPRDAAAAAQPTATPAAEVASHQRVIGDGRDDTDPGRAVGAPSEAPRSTIEAAWSREPTVTGFESESEPGSEPGSEPAPEAADTPEAAPISTASVASSATPPADRPADRVTAPGTLATPSFVREAERAERWRRPGMRAALLAGVLLAAALLGLQALVVFRDQSAARWPELRPLLAQLCAPLGCRVEPLRAIDALVVESSGLVRVDKSDLYRLSIALRNQRSHEVALPAIDLRLTDIQGRLIARRVLRPSELGVGAATVRADTELALQGTLQVAAAPVAGYTIELFYP